MNVLSPVTSAAGAGGRALSSKGQAAAEALKGSAADLVVTLNFENRITPTTVASVVADGGFRGLFGKGDAIRAAEQLAKSGGTNGFVVAKVGSWEYALLTPDRPFDRHFTGYRQEQYAVVVPEHHSIKAAVDA
ncbi:MAG: hypothetical protein JWO69_1165, partial [Thermoleophilia bacterium]|nr:hypothetical protein [Thermoleophilia bacterium]